MPYRNIQFYRCYDGGAGAFCYPTILLHGLGGSHLSWPPTLRRIHGQKIYALDLPGHGASHQSACNSLECHVRKLHKFIEDMDFYGFNLVGHSMGAAIAYAYAKSYPRRIRKLSLICFGNQFHLLHQLDYLLSHISTQNKAVELLMNEGFHAGFPKSERRKIIEPLRKTRPSVLISDIHTCLDANLILFPFPHTFPIQLIAARDDQLVPPFEVECFANGLQNVKLDIIDRCGHMVLFEKTKLIQECLKNFLDEPSAIWS